MSSSFKDLALPSSVQQTLVEIGFSVPTPIQSQAIPPALQGRDLIGSAQTGTGKTAAFCLPILVQLLSDPSRVALVLAPTRELVQQIELFWNSLTRRIPQLRAATVIGGVAMQPQIRQLSRKPRMIIATPGRLVDHLGRRTVDLSKCGWLVLDEADRMLDMGFAPQLNKILEKLPRERQTLLFSATWAPELDRISKTYLREPLRISVDPVSKPAVTVDQSLIQTTVKGKNETLLDELNKRNGQVLVFARTKSRTDRVAKYLASYGVQVNRLHGGRSQGQRNAALHAFRIGQARVLVATDIAARGIDVAGIAHVINYDLPQAAEDYVHRIGRTGRAGATGSALTLITPEDRSQWSEIQRLLKRTNSEARGSSPAFSSATSPRRENRAQHPKWHDKRPHPHARSEARAPRPNRSQRPATDRIIFPLSR